MIKNFNVIVIGAGAAGLMSAIEAGKRGRKVLLIDHANKIGEKIRISGGGRCNFTNLNTDASKFISDNLLPAKTEIIFLLFDMIFDKSILLFISCSING